MPKDPIRMTRQPSGIMDRLDRWTGRRAAWMGAHKKSSIAYGVLAFFILFIALGLWAEAAAPPTKTAAARTPTVVAVAQVPTLAKPTSAPIIQIPMPKATKVGTSTSTPHPSATATPKPTSTPTDTPVPAAQALAARQLGHPVKANKAIVVGFRKDLASLSKFCGWDRDKLVSTIETLHKEIIGVGRKDTLASVSHGYRLLVANETTTGDCQGAITRYLDLRTQSKTIKDLYAEESYTPTPIPTSTPVPTDTPLPTFTPIVTEPDSYLMVKDHPDLYQGDKVRWNCVLNKFLGDDGNGNTIVTCSEFIGAFDGFGEGEIALVVPPTIDTSEMLEGDDLAVLGTVDLPFQGTNAFGATVTEPQLDVFSLTDTGHDLSSLGG